MAEVHDMSMALHQELVTFHKDRREISHILVTFYNDRVTGHDVAMTVNNDRVDLHSVAVTVNNDCVELHDVVVIELAPNQWTHTVYTFRRGLKGMNTYSGKFKKEAVRLLNVSEKPAAHEARDLGMSKSILYRWYDE